MCLELPGTKIENIVFMRRSNIPLKQTILSARHWCRSVKYWGALVRYHPWNKLFYVNWFKQNKRHQPSHTPRTFWVSHIHLGIYQIFGVPEPRLSIGDDDFFQCKKRERGLEANTFLQRKKGRILFPVREWEEGGRGRRVFFYLREIRRLWLKSIFQSIKWISTLSVYREKSLKYTETKKSCHG